jgi:CRISPR/Cas system-associated protein Cas5 (RAMP superfamily)
MSLSLISIIKSDTDFGKRISKKVEEIKKDKQNLSNIADIYGDKYRNEILEGTEKRAKLLSEGASRGLSEDEAMQQYNGFLPTLCCGNQITILIMEINITRKGISLMNSLVCCVRMISKKLF